MPYIHVKILAGTPLPLTYFADQDLPLGTLVRVPLRGKTTSGIVIATNVAKPHKFEAKAIVGIEPFPHDPHYQAFLEQLADYYQLAPADLVGRLRGFFINTPTNLVYVPGEAASEAWGLTPAQQAIVTALAPKISAPTFSPHLIHGVTGSGKTVVYHALIEQALAQNGSTLLLLPEVSLAVTFQEKFKQWLPPELVFGFHSATSAPEKRALWAALKQSRPLLIIGVHLPLLLPIPNLGLIVVDEEHEVGFQEKKHPKINSKQAALLRAQIYQIPIVLGSATPSLYSLAQVKARKWGFFQLKDRFSGDFPTVRVVSLLNKQRRPHFWITKELEKAIAQRLARKEQTIIFMNRRGFCFFVQCKNCSHVFSCANCSVSLTLHEQLRCHYCSHTQPLPSSCPTCQSSELIKKGIGTQLAVSILQDLFPTANIARMDLDATVSRTRTQATLRAMENRSIDILVGTQSITKGYHFPGVTLVGILWADINLNFPMYNAAESCLAQLIQVAGRAGRAAKESEVIVQTMLQHPIFNFINEIDYLKFYAHEIAHRTALGYPPVQELVELELKHKSEAMVEQEAQAIVALLNSKNNSGVQILGPAKPPVHKIQNMHSRKIYLKGRDLEKIAALYHHARDIKLKSSLFYVPNPVTM